MFSVHTSTEKFENTTILPAAETFNSVHLLAHPNMGLTGPTWPPVLIPPFQPPFWICVWGRLGQKNHMYWLPWHRRFEKFRFQLILFQTFSSKSGRSHLRKVVANKRYRIWRFDLETFSILEDWSPRRGGRNQRFDCSCNVIFTK